MMRKLIFGMLSVIAVTAAMTGQVTAQDTSNFVINSFEADYYLERDSNQQPVMKVVEHIQATFPNFDQNHGIERAIPETYKDHSVNLKIESVTDDSGRAWNYTTRQSDDNLVLRIGDADRYVRNLQTYVITYSVENVISFYDNHDELYWDVNGDQWGQEFEHVVARLHIDNSVPAESIQQSKCFTGRYGSTAENCTITQQNNGDITVMTVTARNQLSSNETLSFVISFSANTFAKPPLNWMAIMLLIGWVVVCIAPPLIALVVMIRLWRRSGRDPKGKGIIIPQNQAPKGMNPILAELILTERSTPKAVSAVILDLCVRGYLKIYETEKKKFLSKSQSYELELTKAVDDLSPEEKKVVQILFETKPVVGKNIDLSRQANQLYSKTKELKVVADTRVTEAGYFTTNPETARAKYTGTGIGLIIVGGVLLFVPFVFFSSVGLIIAGIIVLIFSAVMASRTPKGVEAKEHLLGMRDYMKLAESDRIKTLQSPSGAEKLSIDPDDPKQLVKLYEKLLPYAVLFGIEKEWAKQFASLYDTPPDWYHGSRAFNAAVLASAISNTNAATMASFSAPSSSGSSGVSGGGGFSGGGGGGGGGGGW